MATLSLSAVGSLFSDRLLDPKIGAILGFINGKNINFANAETTGATMHNLISHYGKFKATEELERFARKNGLSLVELNLALVTISFAGNKLVGTRFEAEEFRGNKSEQGVRGILSRVNNGLINSDKHGFFNKSIGLIFDTVDITLGFQGLITASGYDAIRSGENTKTIGGFSLGSMDANNLVARGYFPDGVSKSLVFGNIGHSNVKVVIGAFDIVNAGIIGKIFNPSAEILFKNHGCILHGASGCY